MYERLDSTPESFVAYRINDKITGSEFNEIASTLETEIKSKGKLKMLVEIDHMNFPAPGVVWEYLKFAYRNAKNFERFAVMGDKKWEKWWIEAADKMTSTECRYFDVSEKEQAWDWIKH